MKARWFCWLALELAAALAVTSCAGIGDEEPARSAEKRPPVVLVVFDELPTDSLLLPNGRIDAERFPNFAKLASMSTWFPNAHTVYDWTFASVPAILDARLPQPRTAADVRSHQPSVFHLMDRLGYDIFKVESASAVCPPRICVGARARRPGVLSRLAGGGRPERFHRWVGAIRRRPAPSFYFHHALLPHEPWIYLPTGRRNRPIGTDPVRGINKPPGFDDVYLSRHNRLRHLLQVGYVDRELGRLLRRLRRTKLLHRALIVVTADHGYAFDIDATTRRQVTRQNMEAIAPVPFFVKRPRERGGEIDTSVVRTIDVVPTIADVLDTPVYWRHDGRSVFSEAARRADTVEMITRHFTGELRIGVRELARRRAEWRRHWARLFGTGRSSERTHGDPWASAYRIGPNAELLDRRVSRLETAAPGSVAATVFNGGLLRRVDPDAELYPTRVTGRIRGGAPGELRDLAVAVNGRIRAVGRSFHLWRASREYFSMLVPEDALRPGRNRLELFEVEPGGELVPLARV